MEQIDVLKIIGGQVLRHFFSIAFGLLGTYGVTEAMQGQGVEAAVSLSLSVLGLIAVQVASYISKWVAVHMDPPSSTPPDTPITKPPLDTMGQFCLMVLLVPALALSQLACPSQTDIEKAASWGFDTSARVRTSQRVVRELYEGKVVSQDLKDQFFDAALPAFDVLEVYNDTVERQNAAIKACSRLTEEGARSACEKQTTLGAKSILQTIVRSDVVPKLNAMIVKLNLMDAKEAGKLFRIFRTIASGFLTVVEVLDVKDAALVPIKEG